MHASDQGDAARAGFYAKPAIVDAAYAQLIGLCRGCLADRELCDAEIVALDQWLGAYEHLLPEWPGKALARRVKDILRDGEIDEGERQELAEFLSEAAGAETQRFDAPTTLPLTRPEPHIQYEGRVFCLTGTFIHGPRKRVRASVEEWGGSLTDRPSAADYLVIGATVTPAWKFTVHGRKIEEAVSLKAKGHRIAIVSEAHWSATLC
jgi:NAD-dependent DNA ligase